MRDKEQVSQVSWFKKSKYDPKNFNWKFIITNIRKTVVFETPWVILLPGQLVILGWLGLVAAVNRVWARTDNLTMVVVEL